MCIPFGAADPPKLRISVGFLFMPLMEAFGDDNVLFLFLGRASAAAADCEGNSKRPESFNVFVEVPRAVGSTGNTWSAQRFDWSHDNKLTRTARWFSALSTDRPFVGFRQFRRVAATRDAVAVPFWLNPILDLFVPISGKVVNLVQLRAISICPLTFWASQDFRRGWRWVARGAGRCS